jgi:hypothetical protein
MREVKPIMSTFDVERKKRYLQLCSSSAAPTKKSEKAIDAPLFSWMAREELLNQGYNDNQHGLLGHLVEEGEEKEMVLLNTSHPWSAFICGSQGSGKSYTTSCLLENCLTQHDGIGTLRNPMAGIVFRYDRYGTNHCEAVSLCTGEVGVKVQVLLSPFNYKTMERKYKAAIARLGGANPDMFEIKPFYLKSDYLNAERIQKFMASGDGGKPLYMSVSSNAGHGSLITDDEQVVDRVLRNMGLENQGPRSNFERPFSFTAFKKKLGEEKLTEAQQAPLELRLSLLESSMDQVPSTQSSAVAISYHTKPQSKANEAKAGPVQEKKGDWKSTDHLTNEENVEDTLTGEQGCLKILDLTALQVDRASACALFDLALAVFVKTDGPKVVGLDEAIT